MTNGSLSKDEVAALLAGVAESLSGTQEKNVHNASIVLVQYGKEKSSTHVSVHLFSETGWKSAKEYCEKINGLRFAGAEWIHARIVGENEIEKLGQPDKIDMLLAMGDREVQKVIRGIDRDTLAKALKSVDESVKEKILKNMSKRGQEMLQEDMEYMGHVRLKDVDEAQKKIVSTIKNLEDTGEIILNYSHCNSKKK